MAIANGYTTLADVKARLQIDSADTTWDAMLESIVEAVSRWIDSPEGAGRRFFTTMPVAPETEADETRYFTAERADRLGIDDLLTITSLKTDNDGDGVHEYTWATSDYVLSPRNAPLANEPYTSVRRTRDGSYYFPTYEDGVEIVGRFGYCILSCNNAPKQVVEACALQSMRVFKRKDSALGFVSGMEIGQALPIGDVDPDVRMLLNSVSKDTQKVWVV
jgi:hypothetical protein